MKNKTWFSFIGDAVFIKNLQLGLCVYTIYFINKFLIICKIRNIDDNFKPIKLFYRNKKKTIELEFEPDMQITFTQKLSPQKTFNVLNF